MRKMLSAGSLVEMGINQGARETINRQWQFAKKLIVKFGSVAVTIYPHIPSKSKSKILNHLFFGPPRQFESPQAVVANRRSAEMERF